MSSSDNTSPSPSPSPPASPVASYHGQPDLERLIQHFVAAKRSLGSTSSIYRANELVNDSRALIEETAALNARNSFARRTVEQQIETLQEFRDGVADVEEKAGHGFDEVVRGLDAANDKLQATLRDLKQTVVDASLQRNAPTRLDTSEPRSDDDNDGSRSAHASDKTLFDFINEAEHEDMLADLRHLIDNFNDSRAELRHTTAGLDKSIHSIDDGLHDAFKTDLLQTKPSIYDQDPPPSIPSLFRSLENNALALAGSLQSLLSHYDLCVNALKHTEGGGEAAKTAVEDNEGLSKSNEDVEESLFMRKVPDQMEEYERRDMLNVVEHDAAEVEDVVAEIKDRAADMESQWEQLSRHASFARSTFKALRRLLGDMVAIREMLPTYVDAMTSFQATWESISSSIAVKTEDLSNLTQFYSNFIRSYCKLLGEVERRKAVELQMDKLAAKAQKELDKLHAADQHARGEFMEQVGEFLPRDLWTNLAHGGIRWELNRTDHGLAEPP